MNNKEENKKNNPQNKNQDIKNSKDNILNTKKEFNIFSLINMSLKKYKNSTFIILISILNLIFLVLIIFWIYNSNLKQDKLLAELSNQIEMMPKPISQGRLGLIIKKYNDDLMLEINKKNLSLSNKIKEIESLINSYPKPISEGKIGLIIDKKIQKNLSKENLSLSNKIKEIESLINSYPKPISEGKIGLIIDKKIQKNLSSDKGSSLISKQNQEIINEIKIELKNLQLSLENFSKIIGYEKTDKSLTQEIIELKSQKNTDEIQNSSLSNSEDNQFDNINTKEDLSIIMKQFSDFAYNAIKEDLRVNRDSGFLNSIINNFKLIFVQRSLSPQEGNTVDAILSRAEYALNNNNYDKVFQELNTLPKEASEVMDKWRKIFEGYLENNS